MGQDSSQHIERPNIVKARLGQSVLDCFRQDTQVHQEAGAKGTARGLQLSGASSGA